MKNVGRRQPAHRSARSSVAPNGERARWSPGSAKPRHPVSSPSPFQTTKLKYPPANPLASGWLLGGSLIESRGVVMDAPVGKGHIILFGMRPQYRAQSHSTFKLLFNGLFAYAVNTE